MDEGRIIATNPPRADGPAVDRQRTTTIQRMAEQVERLAAHVADGSSKLDAVLSTAAALEKKLTAISGEAVGAATALEEHRKAASQKPAPPTPAVGGQPAANTREPTMLERLEFLNARCEDQTRRWGEAMGLLDSLVGLL